MCLVTSENVVGWLLTTSGWQPAAPQFAFCGWGAGGGLPWHAVHAFCVPSTLPHSGVVAVPPAPAAPSVSVAPWQYTFEHCAPFHCGAVPERELNFTSA